MCPNHSWKKQKGSTSITTTHCSSPSSSNADFALLVPREPRARPSARVPILPFPSLAEPPRELRNADGRTEGSAARGGGSSSRPRLTPLPLILRIVRMTCLNLFKRLREFAELNHATFHLVPSSGSCSWRARQHCRWGCPGARLSVCPPKYETFCRANGVIVAVIDWGRGEEGEGRRG